MVDTPFMIELGEHTLKLKRAGTCDFSTSDTVWHCNDFRQEKTIKYLAEHLEIAL